MHFYNLYILNIFLLLFSSTILWMSATMSSMKGAASCRDIQSANNDTSFSAEKSIRYNVYLDGGQWSEEMQLNFGRVISLPGIRLGAKPTKAATDRFPALRLLAVALSVSYANRVTRPFYQTQNAPPKERFELTYTRPTHLSIFFLFKQNYLRMRLLSFSYPLYFANGVLMLIW